MNNYTDRLVLHNRMLVALDGLGIKIYFRPPTNMTLQYPCVVYTTTQFPRNFANDTTYVSGETYEVSFISPNPGSDDHKRLQTIPYASHIRSYVSDNLVHDVYRISIHSAT